MLFVFGDSFGHDLKHFQSSNEMRKKNGLFPTFDPIEDNWVNLVAKNLTGTTEQINDSMAGCANEFIFHRFMSRMGEIKENDYVIITLTSSDRRWLVERCPHLSNWAGSKIDSEPEGGLTKKEFGAVQQYARYLHSEIASSAIYDAIYWAIVHAAQELEKMNVKLLILPGFLPLRGVVGTLTEACFSEFDSPETQETYYRKTNDIRWNHFSKENHEILADKVTKFFTDYETVDLTTGFKTGIYTKDNI